jgi:hypothetical protein
VGTKSYTFHEDAGGIEMKGCYIFSIPRSGSHLLMELLQNVGFQEIPNEGRPVWTAMQQRVSSGRVIHGGHIPPCEDYIVSLKRLGFVSVVMVRDPRDVVVSHAHFIRKNIELGTPGQLYETCARMDLNQCIEACIMGIPKHLLDISTWFHMYLDWIGHEDVYPVSFEDMALKRGGSYERLLNVLDVGYSPQVYEGVVGRGSFFFRKGIVGDWKNYFTARHRELFTHRAGGLLQELGYGD